MQVSVENVGELEKVLTVHVPNDQLKTEEKNRLQHISKDVHLKGFRRGKAQLSVLKKQFGRRVREEAIQTVIENTLKQALEQENLTPVMMPKVDKIESKADQDLEYRASFEVFPEIQLKDYAEICLKKPIFNIQDSDVQAALEKTQAHLMNWESVEQAATQTDKVKIDYKSTIEGKPYDYCDAEDVPVELNSKRFLPGFEEKLLGAVPGDELTFTLTYPADWGLKAVAGKDAVFKVKVKEVLQKQTPPLDQAFAEKIGAESADETAILAKIKQDLEQQLEHIIHHKQQEALISALIEQNASIDLPKSLLTQEQNLIKEQWQQRIGKIDTLPDAMQKKLEDEAARRVHTSLLWRQVIQKENIALDKKQVESKFLHYMKSGQYKIEDLSDEIKRALMQQVQNDVLIDQVVELLLSKVNFVEEEVSVKTILDGKWPAKTSDEEKEA